MSHTACPSEAELFRFVDQDLPPEQLRRLDKHISSCTSCSHELQSLRTLLEDLAAPIDAPFDPKAHADEVFERLDREKPVPARARYATWGAALAVAAALLLFWFAKADRHFGEQSFDGQLAARGGPAQASLSRDVGVQIYTVMNDGALRALDAGGKLPLGTALTAGLRNLGSEPVFLLLFAVDSDHVVHWLAPQYQDPSTNPQAVVLPPAASKTAEVSASERLLPSAVVFDDLALGSLRVVALLTRQGLHVSDIEALSAVELSLEQLAERFPRAELRQFSVDVIPQ